ncbi:MAG: hypothetical protein A3G41_05880 [Elusimicrobia bacterium RIFCSPLOWO2_12_FULL_59_9]|nr:MAG: hypothetical protein A3G41_05880 [Elusimicrobia bacterium RIFCSPLOWO2_12_FULL_59_9]
MEQLTYSDVISLYEHGALSVSVYYRRHTLLALCELAAKARGVHDPLSRWRLKRFRAVLEEMEGNDEVEVTGETMCDLLQLASGAFERR